MFAYRITWYYETDEESVEEIEDQREHIVTCALAMREAATKTLKYNRSLRKGEFYEFSIFELLNGCWHPHFCDNCKLDDEHEHGPQPNP